MLDPRFFWSEERNETMPGEKLSNFMLLNCLEQLISEPTHFPRDDIETCIDLIFTDKPNCFVDSGVIPSPIQNVSTKSSMVLSTSAFLAPLHTSARSGNMIRQTFRLLKTISDQ